MRDTYLVFDTETTGVDVFNDRVVQIVVATADAEGNLLESWMRYINPGVPVPDGAAEVHGLSTEFLQEHGEDPKKVMSEAIALFRAGHRLVNVAYNLNFDLSILDAEFKRLGISDKFGSGMTRSVQLFDPYVTDRALDKYRKGPRKLMNLADHYSIKYNADDLHDAFADVELTAKVAAKVREQYGLPTNQEQAAWYAEWAEGFRAYLGRQGKDASGVSGDWPLRLEG